MIELNAEILRPYLEGLYGPPVQVVAVLPLGVAPEGTGKEYGYGVPVKIVFRTGRRLRHVVVETVRPGPFGHEHMADRAQSLLWSYTAFDRLPRHLKALDVGGFRTDGSLASLADVEEYFLVVEYGEGAGYSDDLVRLRDTGIMTAEDRRRCTVLSDYLAEIHRVRGSREGLYERRLRELLGHGECLMGLSDSYPPDSVIKPETLEKIEHLCLTWRWRLKPKTHRLRQVHGDFHPGNILFRKGVEFSVLDRSRGEWGEPADDVTSLSLNYLFCSFQRSGRLEGPFETLFLQFWERYLEKTGDREILEVAAPFFAFRGLVTASPVWYPKLENEVRRTLLRFVLNVLNANSFEPERVHEYYR